MAVSIESVVVNSESERRLVLSQANYGAVMSFGTDWNKLRIGARLAITDTGAPLTGTPRFYLGVSAQPTSGFTNGPVGSGTTHFVGIITGGSTWGRLYSNPLLYTTNTNAFVGKKVASSITPASLSSLSVGFSAEPANCRRCIILEIEKGSPDYYFRGVLPSIGNNMPDNTAGWARCFEADEDDLNGVELMLEENAGFYNDVSNPLYTVAVDEGTDGSLNSICIGWDQTTPMHVSDLLFAKVS